MLYLLDANALIDANRDYYPIDRVPQFWDWIIDNSKRERMRICREVLREVIPKKISGQEDDDLTSWVKKNWSTILLTEVPEAATVRDVLDRGYSPDLEEPEIQDLGADPYLIAYAAAARTERCVVTCEVSKPSKKGKNRKIPDVCATLGIQVCDTFNLIRTLDFRA